MQEGSGVGKSDERMDRGLNQQLGKGKRKREKNVGIAWQCRSTAMRCETVVPFWGVVFPLYWVEWLSFAVRDGWMGSNIEFHCVW
jgi:hypothetical protein